MSTSNLTALLLDVYDIYQDCLLLIKNSLKDGAYINVTPQEAICLMQIAYNSTDNLGELAKTGGYMVNNLLFHLNNLSRNHMVALTHKGSHISNITIDMLSTGKDCIEMVNKLHKTKSINKITKRIELLQRHFIK